MCICMCVCWILLLLVFIIFRKTLSYLAHTSNILKAELKNQIIFIK